MQACDAARVAASFVCVVFYIIRCQRTSALSQNWMRSGGFVPGLIADGSLDLGGELWWDLLHSMVRARVLSALLHDFLFGLAASLEIAVHSNISTSDDLCHMGPPFQTHWAFSVEWMTSISLCVASVREVCSYVAVTTIAELDTTRYIHHL